MFSLSLSLLLTAILSSQTVVNAEKVDPKETKQSKNEASSATEEAEDFVADFKEAVGKDDEGRDIYEAIDFSLRDQNGKRHNLKDYEGKIVILNFWQTWCGPCLKEMPDFERVYQDYGQNEEDVIILGVSSPNNSENKKFTNETKTDIEIKDFLMEKDVNYPSLLDYKAELYTNYGIMAFPTTIVILPDGHIFGVAQGAISEDVLKQIINDAKEKKSLEPVTDKGK